MSAHNATLSACVLHAGRLSKASFTVHANSTVEMLGAEPLAEIPLAQIERFDGPIRLPPVEAPPDPQEAPA